MSRSCNETSGVGADGRFVCGTRRSKLKPRSGCPKQSSFRSQLLISDCKSKPKQIKVWFQKRRCQQQSETIAFPVRDNLDVPYSTLTLLESPSLLVRMVIEIIVMYPIQH